MHSGAANSWEIRVGRKFRIFVRCVVNLMQNMLTPSISILQDKDNISLSRNLISRKDSRSRNALQSATNECPLFSVFTDSLFSITEITEYKFFSLIKTLAEFKYKSD